MSDEIKITATCWDGKGEAYFDWKELTVCVDREDITIDGLEGGGAVRISLDVIKRAIAAAEAAEKVKP